MDEQSKPSGRTSEPSPIIFLLWAALFIGGIDRIIRGNDAPFGMLQVCVTVGGIVLYALRRIRSSPRAGRRIAEWTIRVALLVIVVDVGVADIRVGRVIWGIAILALALLMIGIFAAERSGRESTGSSAESNSL
jgi:hypothetical protein